MPVITAYEAAQYLLWHANKKGKSIGNFKMQKLLYYAQGWYIVFNKKKLFDDEFEAWVRGPTIKRLYNLFREVTERNRNPIPVPSDRPKISKHVRKFLKEIWKTFGDFEAFELETMTHSELPWINARKGLKSTEESHNVISIKDIRSHFKRFDAES